MKKTYLTYIILILIIGCAAPDFYSLEDIENPKLGERKQLLYDLAYTQWTKEEIEQGKPWEHLI